MASRYREPGARRPSDGLLRIRSNAPLKNKYRYCEFKHLYFEIQKLINRKVVLSFKYEQLKAPEIRISLIKPLVSSIVELSSISRLKTATNHLAAVSSNHITDTPQFAAYGSLPSSEEQTISTSVIYVILLLKYEFMIQSENNLLMYDLLTTKSTICELLAIRMLREYSSSDRINLLFINPMSHHQEYEQLKHTKHLDSFNTLELSILSKSKKFLSQPVVVGILDRVYNGDLILKDQADHSFKEWPMLVRSISNRPLEESSFAPKYEREAPRTSSSENTLDAEPDKSVVNYKFNRVTIRKVFARANVVPKYQSLVINLKYAYMTLLFLVLVVRHRISQKTGNYGASSILSILFWSVALSFNFDVIAKLLHIEYKFLKKIIWTYVDILIVVLIDVSFILRALSGLEKVPNELYYNCFSLISVLLFPRMLSIFNNYEFFHMIVLSLKRMLWNVIALVCLFGSLIFGFFLCFISLTTDLSMYEVSYAMLKSFFGFTPAVWDNWDRYTNLGRAIQIAYLALMQFVFTTILAIVLSNVFSKVSESNKEEFEYFKTTNLIIYLKWARLQSGLGNNYRLAVVLNYPVKFFKLPIILIIYFYEILIKDNKMDLQKQRKDLKHFTFLNKEEDLYADSDMMIFNQIADTDVDVSSLRLPSRNGSQLGPSRVLSEETGTENDVPKPRRVLRKLATQESHQTLMGFRSGSLDSMFMDEFLGRKYGFGKLREKRSEISKRVPSSELNTTKLSKGLMVKLEEIEEMISQLLARGDTEPIDEFAVRELSHLRPPVTTQQASKDTFSGDDTYEIDQNEMVDSEEFTCSDSE